MSFQALQRFSQLLELSKKAGINQHGFSLARRLGYGNYVVSDGNQGADYCNSENSNTPRLIVDCFSYRKTTIDK